MSHTPGPWRLPGIFRVPASGRHAATWRVIGDKDIHIAQVYGDSDEEVESNAYLIAAAPDLLAACELAVEHGWPQQQQPSECQHCRKTFDAMDVAIAKAKGESS